MTVSKEQQTKNQRLLRRIEVQARTAMGASSIYAEVAKGKFPRPIKLSDRRVAWIESEIDAWIAERIANSKSNIHAMEG